MTQSPTACVAALPRARASRLPPNASRGYTVRGRIPGSPCCGSLLLPRDADQAAEERPAFHHVVRFDRVLLSQALRAMYHNLSPVKTGVVSLDSVYGSQHSSDAPLAHG